MLRREKHTALIQLNFMLRLGHGVPIIRRRQSSSSRAGTDALHALSRPTDKRHVSKPWVGEQPADRKKITGEEENMIHKVIVFNDFN